jgi:hypothetical protein
MSGTVQGEGAERAEVRVCPMDPDYLPYTPYTRGGSLSLSLSLSCPMLSRLPRFLLAPSS